MKLKTIRLRKEELELVEKAFWASLKEVKTVEATTYRREKRVHDEKDVSMDSDSHHRNERPERLFGSV